MTGRPPPRSPLDRVVDEAREDFVPKEPDWSALEARLMARVEEEKKSPARASQERDGRFAKDKLVGLFAVTMAAAAAVALVVREPAPNAPVVSVAEAAPAGSLLSTEGSGEVRIGGKVAAAGHAIVAGDGLETQGARAFLERPKKVSWLLEHESGTARARVKAAGETLVLDLADGAIEAQVTPVPSGEAFAVDVATETSLVRVAVHGTHLRVTRHGSRVVVDLSEGVVSIGTPPRSGSTYGTLVTAPAHVELDANDVAHTLRIDHTPSAVRVPIPLGPGRVASNGTPSEATPPAADPSPTAGAVAARPTPSPSNKTIASAKPIPPREAIVEAVKTCAASLVKGGNVTVTVNSTLALTVGAAGEVTAARFDPPLAPEVQACAAAAIYKVKLVDEPDTNVSLPITYTTKH